MPSNLASPGTRRIPRRGHRRQRIRLFVPLAVLLCVALAVALAVRWGMPPATERATIVPANGHGWSAAGLDGPVPAPGSCHYRVAGNGQPLPDAGCTPGAVDPAVTDQTRDQTVCRPGGYTTSVRPPVGLTEPAKRALLRAYGLAGADAAGYELDHLIPLSAGGASDIRNLWPEPNITRQFPATAFVHNDKDAIEDYTFTALCAGTASVAAAQRAMATDWTTAVDTLGLPPIPPGYRG